MADENDPDRPKDEPSPRPPEGDSAPEPGEEAGSLYEAAPEAPAEPELTTAPEPEDSGPDVAAFVSTEEPSSEPVADPELGPGVALDAAPEEPSSAPVAESEAHDAALFEAEDDWGPAGATQVSPEESSPPTSSIAEPKREPEEPKVAPSLHEATEPEESYELHGAEAAFGPEAGPAPSLHETAEPEEPHEPQGADAEPSAEPYPAAPDQSAAELPPNYFRAAGDPDEPPEAGPSLLHRLRDRVFDTARDAWAFLEPRWVAFAGAARGAAFDVWRRLRGVKRPRTIREAAVWSSWLAAGGVALVVGFFFYVTWGMPSADDVWEARQGQSITFVDRNNNVILREGAQNAPPVELDTLPPYVSQAFIAIEDQHFYQHMGVDFGGMMRAGAENLRAGRVVQGGSTITQQLAKNLFLTNERSWRRKAQEVALAFWLEGRFTKEQILALYLSRVYFGAGAYGIEAAAERYFDRPARELTLLQSATLAGLVKAPSRLNPARQDIAAARARAEVVLGEMVRMGFISPAERDAAMQEELVVSRRNPAGVLSYYRDWIDPLLNEVIGQQRDDFIIETTIDIAAQRAAAEAVEHVLAEQGAQRRAEQAAVIALDDQGGVRAMVGGRDYDVSQFNRATQAHRQPGSSFKYFIYLAAMENGLTPWSIREDAPITIHIDGQPDWSPGNYTHEYHGPVSLTSAFANSFNMVAIRVANEVGGDKVIDVARRLGVRSPLHNYHSLALGAQEITLLEMTQAYGAMAAEGYNVEAHGVARIRRANSDETMWSWRPQRRQRVIEERPMRYMNLMMQRVVEAGTGTRARMPGRQIGGKTGTGNDYRDAWFIGFTPGLVAGVWVGNDNFSETARVTGGSLPADIWARFMPTALRNTPVRDLQLPRPEDFDLGLPQAPVPELTAVGAPIGAAIGTPAAAPPDDQDRSLDFGPEG